MAKIGREEYPELTLSQSVDIAEKVGRQNVKTNAGLAQVMGLKSVDSGYFYHLASALTKYFGVINRTKDSVSLTPLGQRIAHPISDSDRRMALAEAAGRVKLLELLYQSLGHSFHEADFRTKLRDVTGASPAEIEKAGSFVERIYRDAIPYMQQVPPPSGAQPQDGATTPPRSGGESLGSRSGPRSSLTQEPGTRTFEADGVYLAIRQDLDSLEEADAVIQAWLVRERKRARPVQHEDSGGTPGEPPSAH
jgi:hypothetical protein